MTTYGLSIDILKLRNTIPLRLQGDMIVTESIGRIETCTELDAFLRIDIYLPVINKAINELNCRFSGENLAIFRGVGAFMPGSGTFLDSVVLAPFAQHYKANIEDFNLELRQMKQAENKRRNPASFRWRQIDKIGNICFQIWRRFSRNKEIGQHCMYHSRYLGTIRTIFQLFEVN